jgi:two-component system chemotaxis sensor kinase CheA
MSVSEDNKAYPLAVFRKTYFEECAELLDALQSHLDVLANGGGDNETLHAIFRAVHSIKGGGLPPSTPSTMALSSAAASPR